MMLDEFPNCPHCGALSKDFRPGGSSMGPGYLQQGAHCTCNAYLQYTQRTGGNLAVFFHSSQLVPLDEVGEALGFPEVYKQWMDDVVLPTWRHRERHPSPLFIVPKVPSDLQVFIRLLDEGGYRWVQIDDALKEISQQLEIPEDPVLTDARLFSNTLMKRLLDQLELDRLDVAEIENRYHRSGAKGVPPWIQFTIGNCTFSVGWRKRVIAIQVVAPDGLSIVDIEPIAGNDKVTFSVLGAPLHLDTAEDYAAYLDRVLQLDIDRGLEGEALERTRGLLQGIVAKFPEEGGKDVTEIPEPGVAHQLEIHAWSTDKAVEYLTVLGRTALLAGPRL